jgi:hypothetical protein
MKRVFLCLLAVSAASLWCFAQDVPAGFGAASFARIGMDARPLAMGGTGVAITSGSPIPYYNPARLVTAEPLDVGGMYSEPYGADLGVSFQSLGAIGGFDLQSASLTILGVGLTWVQMRVDDIPVWSEETPGEVSFFNATSSLYLASAATEVLPELSVGATAKLYRERILEGRGRGAGIDIGLLASFVVEEASLTLGLNMMDFAGTNVRWTGTAGEPDNYVPWVNKIGASATLFDGLALAAADFDWAVGRPAREQKVHVGVEVHPVGPLFLRAGWSGDLEGSDSKFSAGLGIELLDWFRLDYAYVPPRNLFGTGHFLSLRIAVAVPGGE